MEPDDIIIKWNDEIMTIDSSTLEVVNVSDITISGYDMSQQWISIGDITEDTIDLSNITIREPVEFEDTMPDVAKIEDMCNDYPGLRKAYENFKAVYKMVHQDWQGRQDSKDQFPF